MNKFNLDSLLSRFNKVKGTLPLELAELSKNEFQHNFVEQGFDGKKWEEVQRRIPDTRAYKYPKGKGLGRRTSAILVRTGKLRRSIFVKSVSFPRIVVATGSEAPYAEYHNDGTKNIPRRRFMGQTRQLTNKQIALIKKRLNMISK